MTTIPGASGYLNAATLANVQGSAAQTSNVLGVAEGATSLLDVGRSSLFDNGIGLSSTARQLNKSFIESNASTFNAIFSLGIGATATVEGLQQEILALRASLPSNSIHSSVYETDDGSVSESATGTTIDTSA